MRDLSRPRSRAWRLVVVLTAFLSSVSLRILPRQQGEVVKRRLVLVGGQVYPGPWERPISNGTVLIEDGKISAVGQRGKVHVPPDAEAVDCTGDTIVAGFWNSHVHFTEEKWQSASELPAARLTAQFQQMLTRYGFTSVVDTGSLLSNTVDL